MTKVGQNPTEPDEPEIVVEERATVPEYPWKPWNTRHIETEESEEFHCIPVEDKQPHIYSQGCACEPQNVGERQTYYSGKWLPLYMHNSFDLREIDEWFYFTIQHPEEGNAMVE